MTILILGDLNRNWGFLASPPIPWMPESVNLHSFNYLLLYSASITHLMVILLSILPLQSLYQLHNSSFKHPTLTTLPSLQLTHWIQQALKPAQVSTSKPTTFCHLSSFSYSHSPSMEFSSHRDDLSSVHTLNSLVKGSKSSRRKSTSNQVLLPAYSPFISRQVSTAGKSTQPLSLVLSEHSLLESPYFSSCHYPLIKPDTLPLPKTLTLPQSTHSQLFPEKREAIKRELHLQTNNLLTSLHLYLYCLPGSLSFLPQGVASASSLLSFLPTGIFHIFKTKWTKRSFTPMSSLQLLLQAFRAKFLNRPVPIISSSPHNHSFLDAWVHCKMQLLKSLMNSILPNLMVSSLMLS